MEKIERSEYEKLEIADIVLKPFYGFREDEVYYMVVKHPNRGFVNMILDMITHEDFIYQFRTNLIYTMEK